MLTPAVVIHWKIENVDSWYANMLVPDINYHYLFDQLLYINTKNIMDDVFLSV